MTQAKEWMHLCIFYENFSYQLLLLSLINSISDGKTDIFFFLNDKKWNHHYIVFQFSIQFMLSITFDSGRIISKWFKLPVTNKAEFNNSQ